jgi:hypothetical protein
MEAFMLLGYARRIKANRPLDKRGLQAGAHWNFSAPPLLAAVWTGGTDFSSRTLERRNRNC